MFAQQQQQQQQREVESKQEMSIDKEVDVLILGGGIGGLATAHDLRQLGFPGSILIVERNDAIGGQARSSNLPRTASRSNKGLPTEYCCRTFGPGYRTCRRMMRETPLIVDGEQEREREQESKSTASPKTAKKTVHDNLVDVWDYFVPRSQSPSLRLNYSIDSMLELATGLNEVPWTDKWRLLNRLAYGLTASWDRIEHQMSRQTWAEFQDLNDPLLFTYAVRFTGPVLGVDLYKVNASSVWDNKGYLSILNGPTSEAWFRHWQAWLTEQQGVVIATNTTVTDWRWGGIMSNHVKDWRIESVVVDSKKHGRQTIKAKWVVSALPVESLAVMMRRVPDPPWAGDGFKIDGDPTLKPPGPSLFHIDKLETRSKQWMVAVILYFDQRLRLEHGKTWLWAAETPWQLVIEPQGAIWDPSEPRSKTTTEFWDHREFRAAALGSPHPTKPVPRRRSAEYETSQASYIALHWGDGSVHDIWSVGVCDDQTPGVIHKKPAPECTPRELYEEVWHQLIHTRGFQEEIRTDNGTAFDQLRPVRWSVWDSFQWNRSTQRTETWEPKFSPNAKTFHLRPHTTTEFRNLLTATAFTVNSQEMIL